MAFVEAQRPSWDPQPLDVAVKRSPGRPWDSAAPTKPQRPQLPSLRSIFGPLPDTGRGNVGIDSLSIPRPDSSPAGPESSTSSSRLLQQYSAPLPLPSQQYISPVSLPSATEAWRDRLHSHQLSPNERPASKPSPGSKNNLSSITRSTLAFPPPDRQPSSPASSVGSVGEAEQPSPTLSGSARVRYSHDGAVSPSECPTSPTDRPGSHSSNRKQALAITPRCIGQRMIEGQGLCYVYEDGRYCRATIDGKKVNPTWGITKAGKPRRRLAQACLTCREKKIKCEPAYPSCVQCEKGNRSCKRPRPIRSSTEPVEYSIDTGLSQKRKREAVARSPSNARVDGGQAAATDHVAAAGKIFKSESLNGDFSSPRRSRGLQDFPTNQGPGQSGTAASRDWAPASAHGLGLSVSHQESPYAPVFRWDLDPFDVDREQTAKLLDVYFAQSNVTIIPMFPRDAFLKWAHVGSKTADDVMLLYSLMLIGSIGSSHHRLEIEDRLEETVTMALSRCKSRCTLQLAQSRLLLSCYFLLRGREFESFDALGGAACVLLKLGYNKKQANREPKTEYGLEYESFERCCDRTFWCALVFERLLSRGACSPVILQEDDVSLNAIIYNEAFDGQASVTSPAFEGLPVLDDGVLSLSTLINTSIICGNTNTLLGRSISQPGTIDAEGTHEWRKARALRRLRSLLQNRSPISHSTANVDITYPPSSTTSMEALNHSLRYSSIIRWHRYSRIAELPTQTLMVNMLTGRSNAYELLDHLVNAYQKRGWSSEMERDRSGIGTSARPGDAMPSPFSMRAIIDAMISAIDVLSAGGRVGELPIIIELLRSSLTIVRGIAVHWEPARKSAILIAERVEKLELILPRLSPQPEAKASPALAARKGGDVWRVRERMERIFDVSDDAYYGTDNETFHNAVELMT